MVSLLSWEVFEEQDDEYQKMVVGNSKVNISIEAQSSFGWNDLLEEMAVVFQLIHLVKVENTMIEVFWIYN